MRELTTEQREALVKKYPYLAPINSWTGKLDESYRYDYIHGEYEIPRGWFELFLLYCKAIRQPLIDANYLDKFYFTEVKEKYGTLRLYDAGKPEVASNIESLYSSYSSTICQCCGKPAHFRTAGWVGYYCRCCFKHLPALRRNRVAYKRACIIERVNADGTKQKIKIPYKNLRKKHVKCLKMTTDELVQYLLED